MMGKRKKLNSSSENGTGPKAKRTRTPKLADQAASNSIAESKKLPSEKAWWCSKLFTLPDSSADLEVPFDHLRDILTCYELLQSIGKLLLLEPFSFDELCTALACKERCKLIRDVHICLLSAVLEDDYRRGVCFGSENERDSIHLQWASVDPITWPVCLLSYLEADDRFEHAAAIRMGRPEWQTYPRSPLHLRIAVLKHLCMLAARMESAADACTATAVSFIYFGSDQAGRRYTFTCGHLFVTCPTGEVISYYSSTDKLSTLLQCMRKMDKESHLLSLLEQHQASLSVNFSLGPNGLGRGFSSLVLPDVVGPLPGVDTTGDHPVDRNCDRTTLPGKTVLSSVPLTPVPGASSAAKADVVSDGMSHGTVVRSDAGQPPLVEDCSGRSDDAAILTGDSIPGWSEPANCPSLKMAGRLPGSSSLQDSSFTTVAPELVIGESSLTSHSYANTANIPRSTLTQISKSLASPKTLQAALEISVVGVVPSIQVSARSAQAKKASSLSWPPDAVTDHRRFMKRFQTSQASSRVGRRPDHSFKVYSNEVNAYAVAKRVDIWRQLLGIIANLPPTPAKAFADAGLVAATVLREWLISLEESIPPLLLCSQWPLRRHKWLNAVAECYRHDHFSVLLIHLVKSIRAHAFLPAWNTCMAHDNLKRRDAEEQKAAKESEQVQQFHKEDSLHPPVDEQQLELGGKTAGRKSARKMARPARSNKEKKKKAAADECGLTNIDGSDDATSVPLRFYGKGERVELSKNYCDKINGLDLLLEQDNWCHFSTRHYGRVRSTNPSKQLKVTGPIGRPSTSSVKPSVSVDHLAIVLRKRKLVERGKSDLWFNEVFLDEMLAKKYGSQAGATSVRRGVDTAGVLNARKLIDFVSTACEDSQVPVLAPLSCAQTTASLFTEKASHQARHCFQSSQTFVDKMMKESTKSDVLFPVQLSRHAFTGRPILPKPPSEGQSSDQSGSNQSSDLTTSEPCYPTGNALRVHLSKIFSSWREKGLSLSPFVIAPRHLRRLARSPCKDDFQIPGFVRKKSLFFHQPSLASMWLLRTRSAVSFSSIALQVRLLRALLDIPAVSPPPMGIAVTLDRAVLQDSYSDKLLEKSSIVGRRDLDVDGLRCEYLVRRKRETASAPCADHHGAGQAAGGKDALDNEFCWVAGEDVNAEIIYDYLKVVVEKLARPCFSRNLTELTDCGVEKKLCADDLTPVPISVSKEVEAATAALTALSGGSGQHKLYLLGGFGTHAMLLWLPVSVTLSGVESCRVKLQVAVGGSLQMLTLGKVPPSPSRSFCAEDRDDALREEECRRLLTAMVDQIVCKERPAAKKRMHPPLEGTCEVDASSMDFQLCSKAFLPGDEFLSDGTQLDPSEGLFSPAVQDSHLKSNRQSRPNATHQQSSLPFDSECQTETSSEDATAAVAGLYAKDKVRYSSACTAMSLNSASLRSTIPMLEIMTLPSPPEVEVPKKIPKKRGRKSFLDEQFELNVSDVKVFDFAKLDASEVGGKRLVVDASEQQILFSNAIARAVESHYKRMQKLRQETLGRRVAKLRDEFRSRRRSVVAAETVILQQMSELKASAVSVQRAAPVTVTTASVKAAAPVTMMIRPINTGVCSPPPDVNPSVVRSVRSPPAGGNSAVATKSSGRVVHSTEQLQGNGSPKSPPQNQSQQVVKSQVSLPLTNRFIQIKVPVDVLRDVLTKYRKVPSDVSQPELKGWLQANNLPIASEEATALIAEMMIEESRRQRLRGAMAKPPERCQAASGPGQSSVATSSEKAKENQPAVNASQDVAVVIRPRHQNPSSAHVSSADNILTVTEPPPPTPPVAPALRFSRLPRLAPKSTPSFEGTPSKKGHQHMAQHSSEDTQSARSANVSEPPAKRANIGQDRTRERAAELSSSLSSLPKGKTYRIGRSSSMTTISPVPSEPSELKEKQLELKEQLESKEKQSELKEQSSSSVSGNSAQANDPAKPSRKGKEAQRFSQHTNQLNGNLLSAAASRITQSVRDSAASTVDMPNTPQNSTERQSDDTQLFCLCRTPFDSERFYVACDICSNWYHGDCVGISEEDASTMSSYVCMPCGSTGANQCTPSSKRRRKKLKCSTDAYCICGQPYDHKRLYVMCDECEEWFHVDCVGLSLNLLQQMASYLCMACSRGKQPARSSKAPRKGSKSLSEEHILSLQNLLDTMQKLKCAGPFLAPVNPRDAPHYAEFIAHPMDLKTIENKLVCGCYRTLTEFERDFDLIVSNCVKYNEPDSGVVEAAHSLEKSFKKHLARWKSKHLS